MHDRHVCLRHFAFSVPIKDDNELLIFLPLVDSVPVISRNSKLDGERLSMSPGLLLVPTKLLSSGTNSSPLYHTHPVKTLVVGDANAICGFISTTSYAIYLRACKD
jgi:hypothetical protein